MEFSFGTIPNPVQLAGTAIADMDSNGLDPTPSSAPPEPISSTSGTVPTRVLRSHTKPRPQKPPKSPLPFYAWQLPAHKRYNWGHKKPKYNLIKDYYKSTSLTMAKLKQPRLQKGRRSSKSTGEIQILNPTSGPPLRNGTIIGPHDVVVNSGLGKIKIEEDYIPPQGIKIEPGDLDEANAPGIGVPTIPGHFMEQETETAGAAPASSAVVNFGELIVLKEEPMDYVPTVISSQVGSTSVTTEQEEHALFSYETIGSLRAENEKLQCDLASKNQELLESQQLCSTYEAKLDEKEKEIARLNEQLNKFQKELPTSEQANVMAFQDAQIDENTTMIINEPQSTNEKRIFSNIDEYQDQLTEDSSGSGVVPVNPNPLFDDILDISPDNLDKLQKGIKIIKYNPYICGVPQGPPVCRTLTKGGYEEKIISHDNWNWISESAFVFRKLQLSNTIWKANTYNIPENISKLISQLAPHITTLKFLGLPSVANVPNYKFTKLTELLVQFTCLKELHIVHNPFKNSSSSTFLTSLTKLNTTINIILEIGSYFSKQEADQLTQFGTQMPNLTLIANISGLKEIENQFTKFVNFDPLKLKYECDINVRGKGELEKFTSIYLLHQTKFLKPSLTIHLSDYYNDPHAMGILGSSLVKLSPNFFRLTINYEKNSLSLPNCDWLELTVLGIVRSNCPLEILKRCPKLKALSLLDVDLSFLFSHNPLSVEEHLVKMEYFDNLNELEIVFFRYSCNQYQVQKHKLEILVTQLKKVFPSLRIEIR